MTNSLYSNLIEPNLNNNNTFLILDDRTEISYKDFISLSSKISHKLTNLGLKSGDHILVKSPKCKETLSVLALTCHLLVHSSKYPLCLINLAFSWQPHSNALARKLASARGSLLIRLRSMSLEKSHAGERRDIASLNTPKTPPTAAHCCMAFTPSVLLRTSTKAASYGPRMAETH